jgi:hypothetical protein
MANETASHIHREIPMVRPTLVLLLEQPIPAPQPAVGCHAVTTWLSSRAVSCCPPATAPPQLTSETTRPLPLIAAPVSDRGIREVATAVGRLVSKEIDMLHNVPVRHQQLLPDVLPQELLSHPPDELSDQLALLLQGDGHLEAQEPVDQERPATPGDGRLVVDPSGIEPMAQGDVALDEAALRAHNHARPVQLQHRSASLLITHVEVSRVPS